MNNLFAGDLLIVHSILTPTLDLEFSLHDAESFKVVAKGNERPISRIQGLIRLYSLDFLKSFELVLRNNEGQILMLMRSEGSWFRRAACVWDSNGKVVGKIKKSYTQHDYAGIVNADDKLIARIGYP